MYVKKDTNSKDYTIESNNANQNNHSEKDSSSELSLWKEFKKGDDGALISIYKLYADVLYNYGYQICKDSEILKDVLQDLFMYLLKNREKLSNVNSLKGYLYSSVRRRLMRENSKRSRYLFKERFEDSKDFQIEFSTDKIFIGPKIISKKKGALELAIKKLTARQKEAILLFYYEGLSYEEVATVLTLRNAKSARKLVYRGLSNLKTKIAELITSTISILLIYSEFF